MSNSIELSNNNIIIRNEALDRWIRSIRRYKPLSVDEEVKVIRRYKEEGDKTALDILIQSNQRFLLAAAKTYSRNPDDVLELISEGNIALLKAIENYDITFGFRFLSYASHYIRSRMSDYFDKKRLIKHRIRRDIKKYLQELKSEYIKEFGVEMPKDKIMEAMREKFGRDFKQGGALLEQEHILFDEDYTTEEYNGNSLIDSIAASHNEALDHFEYDDKQSLLTFMLNKNCCGDFERKFMIAKYGLFGQPCLTNLELTNKFNMTDKQIDYLHRKILKRIQQRTRGGILHVKNSASKYQTSETPADPYSKKGHTKTPKKK